MNLRNCTAVLVVMLEPSVQGTPAMWEHLSNAPNMFNGNAPVINGQLLNLNRDITLLYSVPANRNTDTARSKIKIVYPEFVM